MANQNFFTENDFEFILTGYFGRSVLHSSTTKTTSNTYGTETLTQATATRKRIYFIRTAQTFNFAEMGFMERGDAIGACKFSDGIKRDDLIYCDGTDYTISSIDGNSTTISITTTSAHGLTGGDTILIVGTTNYNGKYTVATTPTGSTLTIADTAHDKAAETTGQLVKNFKQYRVKEAISHVGVFNVDSTEGTKTYTVFNLFMEQ